MLPLENANTGNFTKTIYSSLDDHHLLQDTSVSLCTDYIILAEVISFYSH